MSYTAPNNDSADFDLYENGYSTPSNDDANFQLVVDLAPPSNVQITDASTEDELVLDWDSVSDANGYYVYRAQASGSTTSDYAQVADVTTPPYTDTPLEDGEKYFYRVSSYN